MGRSYATLTRRAFEANYLAFHAELPTVVQAPTSVIASRLTADSCRFIHIDASHLYEHVYGDIEAARKLAGPDAIVAFDDFRAEHCPGVAAAVWGAVATMELKLICITGTKAYGTWGDARAGAGRTAGVAGDATDLWHGVEEVAGAPLIRIGGKKAKAPTPPQPLAPGAGRGPEGAEGRDSEPEVARPPGRAGARGRGLLGRALGGRDRG